MSRASDLRAFAISVEQIIRMMPGFVARRALTRAEGTHLTQQLQRGVETALNVAVEMEGRA